MMDSNDDLAELLALTLTVNQHGTRIYSNSQGLRHRVRGPAIEYANGDKAWYQNSLRHRIDGPSEEWADGSRYWYIHGKTYTEEEFNKYIKDNGKCL